tara:strand:+ start:558 stop:767 length:210 start_codon:yes stop_codon:yes gene_type:complete
MLMVEIILNGKKINVDEETNLYEFLEATFSSNTNFAVALNGEFVSKTKYKDVSISRGDEIEVVSAHPGG